MAKLTADYIKSFNFINGGEHPDFMELILKGPENRTMCEIIGNSDPNTKDELGKMYLGRAEDSINDRHISFHLAIGATIQELNPSFNNVDTLILPKINEDIDHKSFLNNNQEDLNKILSKMYKAMQNGKNVFVYCQQGKDRSATIIIAYLMTVYNVSPQEALNYVLNKRCIVSCNDVTELWDFLTNSFVKPSL